MRGSVIGKIKAVNKKRKPQEELLRIQLYGSRLESRRHLLIMTTTDGIWAT